MTFPLSDIITPVLRSFMADPSSLKIKGRFLLLGRIKAKNRESSTFCGKGDIVLML